MNKVKSTYSSSLGVALYVSEQNRSRKARYVSSTRTSAEKRCEELNARGVRAYVTEYSIGKFAIALPDVPISEARTDIPDFEEFAVYTARNGTHTLARQGQQKTTWYIYSHNFATHIQELLRLRGYDCHIVATVNSMHEYYTIRFPEFPEGLPARRATPRNAPQPRKNNPGRPPSSGTALIICCALGEYQIALDLRPALKKCGYASVAILRQDIDTAGDVTRTKKMLQDHNAHVEVVTVDEAKKRLKNGN